MEVRRRVFVIIHSDKNAIKDADGRYEISFDGDILLKKSEKKTINLPPSAQPGAAGLHFFLYRGWPNIGYDRFVTERKVPRRDEKCRRRLQPAPTPARVIGQIGGEIGGNRDGTQNHFFNRNGPAGRIISDKLTQL